MFVAIQAALSVGGRGENIPSDAASANPEPTTSLSTAKPSTPTVKTTALLLKAEATSAAGCDLASTQSGALKRVAGSDNILRESPKPDGTKLINKRATAAIKETHYLTIDSSVTVREECSKSGWSRVQVVEPSHMAASHVGWVKSSVLRNPQKNANGTLIFSEDDIVWDKDTMHHKKLVLAGVNKIHQENPRCKDIDVGSVSKSTSRGTKADPVFFVLCGKGTDSFNAFFAKSDVEKGVNLDGVNLDSSQAVYLCQAHIKNNANYPSTVNLSVLQVIEHPNGRTTVNASFTAKNSFNLELKYNLHCLVDKKGFIEAQIAEAR